MKVRLNGRLVNCRRRRIDRVDTDRSRSKRRVLLLIAIIIDKSKILALTRPLGDVARRPLLALALDPLHIRRVAYATAILTFGIATLGEELDLLKLVLEVNERFGGAEGAETNADRGSCGGGGLLASQGTAAERRERERGGIVGGGKARWGEVVDVGVGDGGRGVGECREVGRGLSNLEAKGGRPLERVEHFLEFDLRGLEWRQCEFGVSYKRREGVGEQESAYNGDEVALVVLPDQSKGLVGLQGESLPQKGGDARPFVPSSGRGEGYTAGDGIAPIHLLSDFEDEKCHPDESRER